jgi:tetratricopeptide repeat protein
VTARRAKLLSPVQRGLCLLAFPALIWLILRNGALALFAQAQPSLALAFRPLSGTALAADAAERRLPSDVRDRIAADALRRDPVSPWPFVAAAQSALERDDPARAATLLEAAVRRNSRQADARRRLFQLYLDDGRWSEAIDEGVVLARLRPSMARNVMEALLLLLDEPRGRAVLAAKLRPQPGGERPGWRESLVAAAVGHPRQVELDRLLRQLDRTVPPDAADRRVRPGS